ncbi:hypothetical protein [Janibacter indicus]|uniref:hypothetical protein n=1 Tax=Janibacter indicus TaxID=857417 RepID=UPI003EB87294
MMANSQQEGTDSNDQTLVEPPMLGGLTTFARVGTWFWRVEAGDRYEWDISHVADQLKLDARVVQVKIEESMPGGMSEKDFFPDEARSSEEGVFTGVDVFTVVTSNRFLTFEVRVPIKNQPVHSDLDSAPSDTYWVAWNGLTAVVMWEQGEPYRPLSGGQVVVSILREAVEGIGASLYVQNCNPGCDFQFLHETLRVVTDPDAYLLDLRIDPLDQEHVAIALPLRRSSLLDVECLGVMVNGGIESFAEFKNLGRRIIDLENQIRGNLGHILGHLNASNLIAAEGWKLSSIAPRWKGRGWRREVRHLISRTWLGISNVDILRRSWDEQCAWLETNEQDAMLLLARDFRSDMSSVRALDLTPVAETVTQVSNGLDNRTVVTATAFGALAGGLAGFMGSLLALLVQ